MTLEARILMAGLYLLIAGGLAFVVWTMFAYFRRSLGGK